MGKRGSRKDKRKLDGPIDPYTGEVELAAKDAYKVVQVVPMDTDNRQGENFLLEEEDAFDKLVLDANTDQVVEQLHQFTDDEEILEDFADRQGLASGGRQKLEDKLNEHNSQSPTLSGGDVDAAWEDSAAAGEESVGGSVPTPDQDIVDEIGQAVGLNYRDDEPLDSDKKILDRDRHRWELDPASTDDLEEDEKE